MVLLVWCFVLIAVSCPMFAGEASITHEFTFDYPMSWADDVVPWGLGGVQKWEIAGGGKPGNALRISAADWKVDVSSEARTLQVNHKPNTPVKISFDIKPVTMPPGSYFLVRYFDGYCGGMPFDKIADDEFAPFPPPIWDSRKPGVKTDWQHVEFTTPPLKHTVLTIAFICQQPPLEEPGGDQSYVEYLLDNLKIKTNLLDNLMDPGFDWHGNAGGSTLDFWYNTNGANADWCDFADQEDVVTDEGIIHFTLCQFRDTSCAAGPANKHILIHEKTCVEVGGLSTVTLSRIHADNSAVSWGVRQTVAYSALGLVSGQEATIQVKMKYTNYDPHPGRARGGDKRISKCQIGVDPYGGIITAAPTVIWSPLDSVNYTADGWSKKTLEFKRPKNSEGFTIFFRHRDGAVGEGSVCFYEPQSKGTLPGCRAIADWVMVKVLDR